MVIEIGDGYGRYSKRDVGMSECWAGGEETCGCFIQGRAANEKREHLRDLQIPVIEDDRYEPSLLHPSMQAAAEFQRRGLDHILTACDLPISSQYGRLIISLGLA